MRLIKVTGGLGNQMFIYAFYLRMKKYYPKVRIDLSDMMHYKVHYGYEMHRVFKLPHTEFCINQYVLPVNLSVLKNGQIKNAYWIYVRHPVHSPFYVLKNI